MLSAMATGTVRHRRLIVSVGVGLAVACPLVALRMPRASFIGFIGFALGSLPVVLGLASLVFAMVVMSRPRPAIFVVEPGTRAFRTLPNAWQVYLAVGTILVGAYSGAMLFGVARLRAADGHPEPSFMTVTEVVMGGLWVVVAAAWVALVWRGGPYVQLRPDGLVALSPFGGLTVPWEALAPGYPIPVPVKANQLALTYARPELVRRSGLIREERIIAVPYVDAGFLTAAIRYYVAYPQHRAAIGTQTEHDRLIHALAGGSYSGLET